MQLIDQPTLSDGLFDSVEIALLQRWTLHLLPLLFTKRPAKHLKTMVFLWWHLYQESVCARCHINRTTWHRRKPDNIYDMDTDELIEGLLMIHHQIDANALLNFRPLQESERVAITLLMMIVAYYRDPTTQSFTQWLQIL